MRPGKSKKSAFCGKSLNVEGRVIGGEEAKVGEFPWYNKFEKNISFSWPARKLTLPKYNLEELSSYAKDPFELMLTNRFAALHDISDPEVKKSDL